MILKSLHASLIELGLERGDALCMFSDITSFGIPNEARDLVLKKGIPSLCDAYIETIQDILGPTGSLFMPAFTYSACDKVVFEVDKSPSTVGTLTEHFRCLPGTVRSAHPIFSFCGRGPLAQKVLEVTDFDCFGPDSFFSKFLKHGGRYLLFGTSIQRAATFVYYSLQKMRVPYRFFKNFPAEIASHRGIQSVVVPYFVRNLEMKYDDTWGNIEALGHATGVIQQTNYSSHSLSLMGSSEIDALICNELLKNPECLITKHHEAIAS